MKLKLIYVLLLFAPALLSAGTYSLTGDTIWFLDGRKMHVKVHTLTPVEVICRNPKTNKEFTIENERIYSVFMENKKLDLVIYRRDSIKGYPYTIEEMRYFVRGGYDARKGFRNPVPFISGFLVGAGAVIATKGFFLSPIAPIAYVGVVAIPKIRIKHKHVSDPECLKHDTYILGYEHYARSKKMWNALAGGILGIGAGYAAWFGFVKQ